MKLRVFLSPRQVGILTYGYPLSITGFVSLGEARHSWHKKTVSQNPSLHLLFPVLTRDFFFESNFWKSANDPSFEKPSFISCEPIALLSFLTIALSPCRSSSRRAHCSNTWIHPFMFNIFRLLILRTSQNENNKSSDQDCCFQTLNWWKKTNILDQHQLQSPKSQGIRSEVPTVCFVPTVVVAPWMESNIFLEDRAPLNGDVGKGI